MFQLPSCLSAGLPLRLSLIMVHMWLIVVRFYKLVTYLNDHGNGLQVYFSPFCWIAVIVPIVDTCRHVSKIRVGCRHLCFSISLYSVSLLTAVLVYPLLSVAW